MEPRTTVDRTNIVEDFHNMTGLTYINKYGFNKYGMVVPTKEEFGQAPLPTKWDEERLARFEPEHDLDDPIELLDLTENLLARLHEAEIKTIRQVAEKGFSFWHQFFKYVQFFGKKRQHIFLCQIEPYQQQLKGVLD